MSVGFIANWFFAASPIDRLVLVKAIWLGVFQFPIIGNYFHFSVLEDTHTKVGGAEINANCRSLRYGCFSVKLQRREIPTAVPMSNPLFQLGLPSPLGFAMLVQAFDPAGMALYVSFVGFCVCVSVCVFPINVSINYCCITNNPKTDWFKVIIYSQLYNMGWDQFDDSFAGWLSLSCSCSHL